MALATRPAPGMRPTPDSAALARLTMALDDIPGPLDANTLAGATARLVAAIFALAPPASGHSLLRWQCLAQVAARDLSLAKLYEAHTDALAILAELGEPREAPQDPAAPEIWAVWAARTPGRDLHLTAARDPTPGRSLGSHITLNGTKAWCSGAAFVTHALVTCIDEAGRDWLAAVALEQPGVTVTDRGWNAVGMQATQSVEVDFEDVPAKRIGICGAYLARPGFWHGGAGIAACWYGAAAALAIRLRETAQRRDDPHLRAHLGSADAALAAARSLLRETAAEIDATPDTDAMARALRVRASVECAVEATLRACARGLGAGPLCRERWFARMSADLPVFVRQSHAESDLATLGAAVAAAGADWQL
jgi:alkylation response protein AidB-like acyl-CoA dehydrogenase